MSPSYKRQHLVSKVLQARFAVIGSTGKRISRLRRSDPDTDPVLVGLNNNLKEDWFIEERAGASRFEQIWGRTESVIGRAFAEIDSHRAGQPVSAASVAGISNLMALHLVRSVTATALWNRGLARVVPKRRAAMMTNETLIRLAREAGVYPRSWSDTQIVDEIIAGLEDPLRKGGEAFGETLVELYESVRQRFNRLHLEIGEANGGEFILPDAPCVPFESRTGRVGLLSGFGLNKSDAIVMPLGPRHIASLVTSLPATPWLVLDADKVALVNDALAQAALDAAYFRPGSGLETQVRSRWAGEAAGRDER